MISIGAMKASALNSSFLPNLPKDDFAEAARLPLRYSLGMGFLPIFYAGLYLLVACAAYIFCKVLSRRRGIARAVFIAILAFGACSYVGFIVIVLAVGESPLKGLLEGAAQRPTYTLAYFLPGFIGAWLSIKALKSVAFDRELS